MSNIFLRNYHQRIISGIERNVKIYHPSRVNLSKGLNAITPYSFYLTTLLSLLLGNRTRLVRLFALRGRGAIQTQFSA